MLGSSALLRSLKLWSNQSKLDVIQICELIQWGVSDTQWAAKIVDEILMFSKWQL